jgi:hypothetical protein
MHRSVVAMGFATWSILCVYSPIAAAQVVVALDAVGGSGERGRVVLADVPVGAPVLRISITLVGEPRDAVQPTYVRCGVCAPNGVKSRRLASAYHGESITILPGLSVRQLTTARASFEVHRSASDSTVVASGTVRLMRIASGVESLYRQ